MIYHSTILSANVLSYSSVMGLTIMELCKVMGECSSNAREIIGLRAKGRERMHTGIYCNLYILSIGCLSINTDIYEVLIAQY